MPEKRKELTAHYYKDIKSAGNETAKKEIFITFLTKLFADKDENGIISQFAAGAETGIYNIIRHGKKSGHGKADTQYGNVIIEFENNLERTGAHAEEQLKEYLSGNWNSGIKGRFTLIASDCLIWQVYTLDYESLCNIGKISADKLNLQLVEKFEVKPDKAEEFYLFLDRCLFGIEPIPATLDNIRRMFGSTSVTFKSAMTYMRMAYERIENNPELEVAKSQWLKFLSIAYGRFDATEYIFLVHSYLSVLAKMLAYEVISQVPYLTDEVISEIAAGEVFKRFNIANFTDNDFFRWTASHDPDLRKAFRIMANEIALLDFSHVTGDILKGVYQELVDDDTRHALGEHYTPDWLCAKMVEEVMPKQGQKILDPACGSGSFLKAAANYLIGHNPEMSAGELNNCLYGIDVHPLSVQITKATLLMAYGNRLPRESEPISLNVFLANSLLLPEEDIELMGGTCAISIDETRIYVPQTLFRDQNLFARLVQFAEDYADNDYKNENVRNNRQLEKIFENGLKITDKSTLETTIAVYNALLKAKRANRNGIWAYILANTFAPISLKGQFDLILGNPPWLTFKDILAANYQNDIMAIAKSTNCLPDNAHLFTQLELASIFAAWCLFYFLKPDGKLAFVMPRSVFTADQHHKMREGQIQYKVDDKQFEYLKVTELWDLLSVSPLFKIPSCVLFAEKVNLREQQDKKIAGKIFKGILPLHNSEPNVADQKLQIDDTVFYLSNLNKRTAWSGENIKSVKPSDYKSKFYNGATLFPRSICFVEFDQEISGSLKNRKIRVKTSSVIKRDAKEPWKPISIAGTISSKYLYSTALANNLVPFGITGSHMVVLPVMKQGGKMILAAPEDFEESGDLNTAKWFSEAEKQWEEYKTDRNKNIEFKDYLNWQNKLLKQFHSKKYTVLYSKAGKNTVAVYLDTSMMEIPFIAENVSYWFKTGSKDEALYLTAYFNSKIPNEIIKPFQSAGLFGARNIDKKILDLPLPAFDPENPVHNEMAKLAQQATDKTAKFIAAKNLDQYGNNMDARECGKFRNEVRRHIAGEMAEIDALVKRVLEKE